ncbi:fimbria/pilus outer membrane usher protein [Sphingosinicella xenopeptidilytica]|uniref:Fimbria/pilus outer membrane usher protein n=1 Tax=Sphingosinicella xenopeptidilytica TaxID=364098 RepID=A0ABW3C217_SPHXN
MTTASPALAASSEYDVLPPPVPSATLEDVPLQLELVINGAATGAIVPVLMRADGPVVQGADLKRADLPIDGDETRLIALSAIPEVDAEYDAANQRLALSVPPEWLPRQRLGVTEISDEPARSSPGAVFNYELFVSDPDGRKATLSLWNEARVFGPAGIASTTGVWQTGSHGTRFTRYDSRWTRSNEARMVTWEAGDLITRGLPWTGAVRLGGVQVSRDFAVRPDVVTYPLPEFAGEAALPSTVELFINDHRAGGAAIEPGPFTMSTRPQISGAGEANLTVTDALGRRVTTTLPFYVSSALLRPGLTDYAVSGGLLRRNYGTRNFDYGEAAASASLRRGITDAVTLEAHAEASEHVVLGGIGGVFGVGNAGIVSASYSHSGHHGMEGGQVSVGYAYQARRFSLSANHIRRDIDFADIAIEGHMAAWRRLSSVTASVSTGRYGNLGAAWFETRDSKGDKARLATASWALPLGRLARLYMSASREFEDKTWSASTSLSIPFGGDGGMASSGYVRETDGSNSWRADYSRAVPSEGGLGFSMGAARYRGTDLYAQGDFTWRGPNVEVRGGAYGSARGVTRWAGASGSLVMMDNAVFAANRIADAFVLVSTGEPNIPVRYENQRVGRSNGKGHLLVPWATSYYRAKYEIDPLGLPPSIETPVVEQRIAVTRGSGYLLAFPVKRLVAARITLRDSSGAPLPVGSAVAVNGMPGAYVGWDGFLYLETLAPRNRLSVRLPDDSICTATFAAENAEGVIDAGTLTCQ